MTTTPDVYRGCKENMVKEMTYTPDVASEAVMKQKRTLFQILVNEGLITWKDYNGSCSELTLVKLSYPLTLKNYFMYLKFESNFVKIKLFGSPEN